MGDIVTGLVRNLSTLANLRASSNRGCFLQRQQAPSKKLSDAADAARICTFPKPFVVGLRCRRCNSHSTWPALFPCFAQVSRLRVKPSLHSLAPLSTDFSHVSTQDPNQPTSEAPAPATIELRIGGELRQLAYEQAFVAACSLLDHGQVDAASTIFERLEAFRDRGPRAFIMHAFCESAAKHYDNCKAVLDEAFKDGPEGVANRLQDAFVSYHVGIKAEGRQAMAELVDEQQHLPTLCLIMGNILQSSGDLTLARRCWNLAIERDRPQGAVAAAANDKLHSSAL